MTPTDRHQLDTLVQRYGRAAIMAALTPPTVGTRETEPCPAATVGWRGHLGGRDLLNVGTQPSHDAEAVLSAAPHLTDAVRHPMGFALVLVGSNKWRGAVAGTEEGHLLVHPIDSTGAVLEEVHTIDPRLVVPVLPAR